MPFAESIPKPHGREFPSTAAAKAGLALTCPVRAGMDAENRRHVRMGPSKPPALPEGNRTASSIVFGELASYATLRFTSGGG